MYFVLKSVSPDASYTDYQRLRPARIYLSKEINKSGRMITIIDDNDMLDMLLSETDKANPHQLRSYVLLYAIAEPDDTLLSSSRIFAGIVYNRDITIQDGNTTIRTESLDDINNLAETVTRGAVAPWSTVVNYIPEYFQSTDAAMTPLKSGHATYGLWFYPALATTQAWCPVTGDWATVYTTSLDGIIGAADVTITTNTTNHRRMKQRGIIKIVDAVGDDEYVYYEGYGLNAAGDGYEFRNCIRGCFGVAASAHTDAELELRQFVPARMYIKNGDWSLDYDTAPKNTRITPHPEDGYFKFDIVPANATATYKYVNENDAAGHAGGTAFWTLAGLLESIIEQGNPVGPGYTVGATAAIEVPDIVIPGTYIDGSDVLTTILKLIDERGLTGHVYDATYPNSQPRIGLWMDYDHVATTEINIGAITQVNASAIIWPGFTSVKYKYTMDNTYTAVSVVYTDTGTGARRSRVIYLTDTHGATNYDSVLDADAFDKFMGFRNGYRRVKTIERGNMSEGEATALAESILRQGLVLPDQRVYEVDQFPDLDIFNAISVGDTIRMPDAYYGLLTRYDLRLEHGIIHGTLYLSDTLGGVY